MSLRLHEEAYHCFGKCLLSLHFPVIQHEKCVDVLVEKLCTFFRQEMTLSDFADSSSFSKEDLIVLQNLTRDVFVWNDLPKGFT